MSEKIAIIGAGLSGLAAAYALTRSGKQVCVFEKSRGLSGRAASRTKNGCRYDYGANYFTVESNEVASLLFRELPAEGLCRIVGDIRSFDEWGEVKEGDPRRNVKAKWTYRDGISTIGKRMVEKAGLTVMTETRISRMAKTGGKWYLETEGGNTFDSFDAVLLTPPAPQMIGLLEASEFDPMMRNGIVRELKRAEYLSQFTVILNFTGHFSLPGDAYALINSDRRHEIAWISHENRKPGHVPDGETLFIAQMSHAWSVLHFDQPVDAMIEAAFEETTGLLGTKLPSPNWTDFQRWRYAHPVSAADGDRLHPASAIRLFFAGDSFSGKGRVASAIESGLSAARQIAEDF